MRSPGARGALVVVAGLVALLSVVYAGVVRCDFAFDDADFLSPAQVRAGLTWAGVRWSLTAQVAGNWHPLTLLSHMIDVELFGMNPLPQHVVNVLLHGLNTLLLLGVLRALTGELWRSALVAALFAIHPLHVESVAWIAERKDVLSTLFGLLALAAYARYLARPGIASYLLVALCYAASLASKPMLVTLPFVLLLLDCWPLNRGVRGRVLLEKVPLFLGAAAASVIALSVQRAGGAMAEAQRFPLGARVQNAATSYLEYLRKTVWPSDLGVMYPHPGGDVAVGMAAVGAGAVLLISVLAVLGRRRYPAFAVGWFWFGGTLVPVIGLVQVGDQALADRYTYLPIVGLFLGGAWSVPGGRASVRRRAALALGLAVALAALAALAARQVGFWENNRSLYRRALAVAPGNWMMHANLAAELQAAGENLEALAHQREVVRLRPELAEAHHNLALALERVGLNKEAIAEHRECLRLNPHHPRADRILGRVLLKLDQPAAALPHLTRGVRAQPDNAEVHLHVGEAYLRLGDLEAAEAALREAVRIEPNNTWTRTYWDSVRARLPQRH